MTSPPNSSSAPPVAPAILAIDVGGTKFAAGLVTPKVICSTARVTAVAQDVGPEAHFDNLAAIVEQQMEHADRHDLRVAAVGVGCSGPITSNCESVSPSSISSWREFPLASVCAS